MAGAGKKRQANPYDDFGKKANHTSEWLDGIAKNRSGLDGVSTNFRKISKTDITDNPQGFTRKRPGDRFEIKKTKRPWKAVCLGSIADSIGPDLANMVSHDVAKSEAEMLRTS